jgi:hypothetical protein
LSKNVKRPAQKIELTPEKRPKTAFSRNQIEGRPLAWRFSHADKEGKWAWSGWNAKPAEFLAVLERLHSYESLNWTEIIATGSHPIALGKLTPEAVKRLQTKKLDDIDEIMSFRINGEERVFCIRHENIMNILWYDPNHEVCPSQKKHT